MPDLAIVGPVRGLGGRVTGLASRAIATWTARILVDDGALIVTRHPPLLPMCGLSGPGRDLQTATGPVGFAHALGVTVRGLADCVCVRLAVVRSGVTSRVHTSPATGHVTVRPFLLTVRGLGKGVGGLGGVAGIAQRQLLLPGIAATLGRGWSLPLWLLLPPFLDSRPLCRTLPGCSSACRGPWHSGMFKAAGVTGAGCCLALPLR